VACVELPAKVKLGILPGAADDTAAESAGVDIGELYRKTRDVQQRVS
jgi:hypothetical protein